ncbi:MAG: alpha/beta hydrolase [Clostridia bacterium]|nr:alpha/beta hydrolase [Clostridia bacterium]
MEKEKTNIFDEFTDVAYCVDERQKFDLFIPRTDEKELPMMIFIHGGGWKSGDKSDYTDEMKRICEKYPVCCLSVGYRFIGEEMAVTYREIQTDVANAIHTAVKYVESLGKTVTKKGIGGISAGAYNSMMYAFSKNSVNPGSFAFVLDKSGPCDLTDSECYKGTAELPKDMAFRIYGQLLGSELDEDSFKSPDVLEKLKDASPLFHADENSPAVIIAHSENDLVVPAGCAKRLLEKLNSLGIQVDYVDMEGCGHSETIEKVEQKIRLKLDEYIEKYLL